MFLGYFAGFLIAGFTNGISQVVIGRNLMIRARGQPFPDYMKNALISLDVFFTSGLCASSTGVLETEKWRLDAVFGFFVALFKVSAQAPRGDHKHALVLVLPIGLRRYRSHFFRELYLDPRLAA